tara:strand:- start:1512 stop:2474 length:963 start_codon:yes stop_codon:yes gene_type:complete
VNLLALAHQLNGELFGNAKLEVSKLSGLEFATKDDITFVLTAKEIKKALDSPAIAFICFKKIDGLENQIVVTNPRQALAAAIEYYLKEQSADKNKVKPKLAASSNVHSSVVIDVNSSVGDNTCIEAHVVIGKNCHIGDNVLIHPNVTLYDNTTIGNHCIIHAGSVIGADGFGYYQSGAELKKIPHIGQTILEDMVEIGANTTIDRGCLNETRISRGTKIDNLVHIAHNSFVGSCSAIAAQVGVTGSSKIGNYVMIGGQAGIDGVKIGDQVTIAGKAGVTKSFPANSKLSGFPAQDHYTQQRYKAALRSLVKEKWQKGEKK